MFFDNMMGPLGLAVAIGGLVPYFIPDGAANSKKKKAITGTVVAVLSCAMILLVWSGNQKIEDVARTIKQEIGTGKMTSEQLYQRVTPEQGLLIPTALARLSERREIKCTPQNLHAADDPDTDYPERVYSLPK